MKYALRDYRVRLLLCCRPLSILVAEENGPYHRAGIHIHTLFSRRHNHAHDPANRFNSWRQLN